MKVSLLIALAVLNITGCVGGQNRRVQRHRPYQGQSVRQLTKMFEGGGAEDITSEEVQNRRPYQSPQANSLAKRFEATEDEDAALEAVVKEMNEPTRLDVSSEMEQRRPRQTPLINKLADQFNVYDDEWENYEETLPMPKMSQEVYRERLREEPLIVDSYGEMSLPAPPLVVVEEAIEYIRPVDSPIQVPIRVQNERALPPAKRDMPRRRKGRGRAAPPQPQQQRGGRKGKWKNVYHADWNQFVNDAGAGAIDQHLRR